MPQKRLGLKSPSTGQLLRVHRGRVERRQRWVRLWLIRRQVGRDCHSCRRKLLLLLLHRERGEARDSNRDGLQGRREGRLLAMNLSRSSCRPLGSKCWNLLVNMAEELLSKGL